MTRFCFFQPSHNIKIGKREKDKMKKTDTMMKVTWNINGYTATATIVGLYSWSLSLFWKHANTSEKVLTIADLEWPQAVASAVFSFSQDQCCFKVHRFFNNLLETLPFITLLLLYKCVSFYHTVGDMWKLQCESQFLFRIYFILF